MMNTTVSEDQIRSRLSRLYRSYGYLPYKVNKFEEYDLYAQYKSFLACKQILTFSDTDGRLMALKPDVTLSVIKSASDRCPVHKVFYNENVYRVPEDGDGFSEIKIYVPGLKPFYKFRIYSVIYRVIYGKISNINIYYIYG